MQSAAAAMHTGTMAIWQFDVCILPGSAPTLSHGPDGYVATSVDACTAKRVMDWCEERWTRQTWMDDFFVFGEDQGCRIDVLRDESGGAELSARIDLRSPHGDFCNAVTQLASGIDCVLFSPELWCPIPLEAGELATAASRSRAARFVDDPYRTLRDSA